MAAPETTHLVKISRILWRSIQKGELKKAKNSGDVIEKLCEVGHTSSKEKLWEDLEESGERKVTLSDES